MMQECAEGVFLYSPYNISPMAHKIMGSKLNLP